MIGTVVRSRPAGAGAAAVVFLVIGVLAVVAAALVPSVHWAVFAILPFVIGLTSLLLHDPAVQFEITAEGLSFETPETVFVRYDDIQGLTARGEQAADEFPMQLYHSGGVVRIPARLDVPSWRLQRFILERLPEASAADPDDAPASLRGFVAEQVALFGAGKVLVFRARPHPPLSSHGRHVAYSLAVALGGLGWVAAGAVLMSVLDKKDTKEMPGWIAGGVALLVVGLICAFGFSRSRGSGRVRDWRGSCLVVSPGGFALVQGPLRGKMRWDELRAVELPAKPRFGLATAGGATRGIGLLVEGAYLVIADYYDRPLSVIHAHLTAYWGGRDAN